MSFAYRVLFLQILAITLFAHPSRCGADEVSPPPMIITVDARTPWKPRIPVRLTLPAAPGPLTLVFPRWLPGMHAPEGPLGRFGRIGITADGVPLAWDRDPFDPYLIHTTVPAGARTVEASYEYITTNGSDEVFFGVAASHNLAVINPAAFSVAPQGDSHTMRARMSISFPIGWGVSSALATDTAPGGSPGTVTFAPVSLYTLIDSPVMAGSFHRSIGLVVPPGDVHHSLDLYAESEEVLRARAPVVTPLITRLVAESGHMFGMRHYRSFHFMLGLTAEVGRNGLEHHEGVAYILEPDDLDESKRQLPQSSWNMMLIPHEFVHSWNGKYRRPYGEDARTNVATQSADLIWVYEGLTQYLGDVLMARSGFRTPESLRNDLLMRAATLRFGAGRDWESLADAALVAPYTYVHGTGTALRSVNDVYYESEMAWLEADAIIRRQSKGMRSLDDFCALFFGGINRGAETLTYTRKDVVDALNRIVAYDWAGFVQNRFYTAPKALPTWGFEASGWRLTYTDKSAVPSPGLPDYRHTFGAFIASGGRVIDVVPGSLAERAGLVANDNVMGVNGTLFSIGSLQEAVRATRGRKIPLELLISEGVKYRTIRIEGIDGERFPVLTRDPAHPDLYAAITASTSPPIKPAGVK